MNVLRVLITVTYLRSVLTLMAASHASVQRVQRVQRVQEVDLHSAQVRCCLSCPVIVVCTTNFLNTDINECSEGIDDCDINADCADTDGSFTCICRQGYSGNGTFCISKSVMACYSNNHYVNTIFC